MRAQVLVIGGGAFGASCFYFRYDTPARIVAGPHWEVHGEAERPQDPDAFRQAVDRFAPGGSVGSSDHYNGPWR